MGDQTERMYELMRKESNRLKTFQMNPPWPKDYVDIKKLAKAGFFYAFNGDNVHCAFCRGQVCRWDRDDDPITEHSRHFTTCPFVMGGEVGNEPLGEDPFPGPKRPRPYDVCGPFPNFPQNDPRSLTSPTSPAQQRHIEVDNTSINQAVNVVIDSNNRSANINDISQPQQQDQNQHPHDHNQQHLHHNYNLEHPSSQTHQPEQHQHHNHQEQRQHHHHHHHSQNQSQLAREPSPSPSRPPSSQSSHYNSLIGICKICYTNSIELVFLPCGHSVSCLSCAQSLYTCPYCRETITTRIRQYLV